MKAFVNALSYISGEGIARRNIVFDDRIVRIGGDVDGAEEVRIPDDAVVVAGFIDGHIHGAGGSDAMDGTADALATIAATLAREGTTAFLATTMTASERDTIAAMTAVKEYVSRGNADGARIIGVHLEGPFVSEKYKGAQPLEHITSPDIALYDKFDAACGGMVKTVTLAPEKDGALKLIRHLCDKGVISSIGHTAATAQEMKKAVDIGAAAVTHTFNAQSPFAHRDVGAAGIALGDDRLDCEIIADGIHVCADAVRLLVRCKPHDKITLITDSIRAKGVGGGVSELGGQTVYVNDGQARLADGTLAGSVLRMDSAVKFMVEKAGLSLGEAVDLATVNPAKKLGMYDLMGNIEVGKRADFTVLDGKLSAIRTVVGGKIVF